MKVLMIMIALMASSLAFAAEKDYQIAWCEAHGGKWKYKDVVLPDKTIPDCITDIYAIEVDWDKKWAESIGQSLHYARLTGLRAGVLLIVSPKGGRYVNRVQRIIDHYGLPITVFTVSK